MKSQYGNRDTVGTIYLDAQKNSTQGLLLPDIGSEMLPGLVEDINLTVQSNPFEGKPFYINVVEERDLQMKNSFKRRMFTTLYRPYPEDNTLVFHVFPQENEICYCWDLPHHSELLNILCNKGSYDHEYICRINEWLSSDLSNFGFVKVSLNSSQVEGYEEKSINAYRSAYYNYCKTLEMSDADLENEKKLGFFWLPNKFVKDKSLTHPETAKISMVCV